MRLALPPRLPGLQVRFGVLVSSAQSICFLGACVSRSCCASLGLAQIKCSRPTPSKGCADKRRPADACLSALFRYAFGCLDSRHNHSTPFKIYKRCPSLGFAQTQSMCASATRTARAAVANQDGCALDTIKACSSPRLASGPMYQTKKRKRVLIMSTWKPSTSESTAPPAQVNVFTTVGVRRAPPWRPAAASACA